MPATLGALTRSVAAERNSKRDTIRSELCARLRPQLKLRAHRSYKYLEKRVCYMPNFR